MTASAVIDCGTNTVRLLVAGDDAVVERRMTVTRLGEGVHRSRRLTDVAMGRTLEALREYSKVMEEHGVGRFVVAATSAARDAVNRNEFFDRAQEVLGARPLLLSGDDEARFTYDGATSGLEAGRYLVVDIGGGSTELAVGPGGPLPGVSVDIGSVRLTEQALTGDPYSVPELEQAAAIASASIEEGARALAVQPEGRRLVGVAGTITTLAAVDLGLTSYSRERIHHHTLRRSRLEELFLQLSAMSHTERLAMPSLPDDRADVIVAGLIVLRSAMDTFGFSECLVSENDILDGLLAELERGGFSPP